MYFTIVKRFITNSKRNIESLKMSKCPVDTWNLILVNILCRKLDFGSKKAYEEERDRSQLPSLDEFFEILEKRCAVLETLGNHSTRNPKMLNDTNARNNFTNSNNKSFSKVSPVATLLSNVNSSENSSNEVHQKKLHRIYTCDKFKVLNCQQKMNFVTSKDLCFNCLGNRHRANQCNSRKCMFKVTPHIVAFRCDL